MRNLYAIYLYITNNGEQSLTIRGNREELLKEEKRGHRKVRKVDCIQISKCCHILLSTQTISVEWCKKSMAFKIALFDKINRFSSLNMYINLEKDLNAE